MKVTVVNIRLPSEIVSWLDTLVENNVYNSRSEAIRDYSRKYVLKYRGGKF